MTGRISRHTALPRQRVHPVRDLKCSELGLESCVTEFEILFLIGGSDEKERNREV